MAGIKTHTNNTTDLDLEVAIRVGKAWRELRRGAMVSDARDAIYGVGGSAIEPAQMDALDFLTTVDSCRMSEFAEHLRIDPSTATRAVQRLIKDNLAERLEHTGDARVVTISISERGRRIHGEVADRRRAILLRVLDDFELEERHQLADLLERFSVAVDNAVAEKTRRRH